MSEEARSMVVWTLSVSGTALLMVGVMHRADFGNWGYGGGFGVTLVPAVLLLLGSLAVANTRNPERW